MAYRQHSLPPDRFRPPLAAATVALSRCRGASYTGFAADARPPRAGVSGRYPVIPPVELPVIQTTVFCCLSADFLPPANESHSLRNHHPDSRPTWRQNNKPHPSARDHGNTEPVPESSHLHFHRHSTEHRENEMGKSLFYKNRKMLWMFSVIGIAFAFLPGLFCPALWFFSLFYAIIYTWSSILIFR